MSDEDTTTAAETVEAPPAKTVPYDRFREVNETSKALKSELEELRSTLQEREDAELSVAEREKAARAREAERADAAEQRALGLERGAWLRDAASKAGFADSGDAVAFVDVKSVETEAQAARAIRDLGERKPHLLAVKDEPPQIGQVLRDGEPANAGGHSKVSEQMSRAIRQAAGRET